MTANCSFCDIAAGKVTANLVYEDDHVCAFLDAGPIRQGHTQIIPRKHVETFEELPPALATAIMFLGQRIATVQKRIWGVDRVAFLFTGGDVPHAHAHVVPLHCKTDITSARYIAETNLTFRPCPAPAGEELEKVAAQLRATLTQDAQQREN